MIQSWIFRLLFAALALPILMCILFGLGYLLTALGDLDAAAVVVRVNLAVAVLWVFDLVLLIVALAIGSVAQAAGETARDESILIQADEELKP